MVWIKKYEAGDLTREIHLQEEVVEYGAKIAALERKIGQPTMELDVMKKRALIRPSQQGARPSAESTALFRSDFSRPCMTTSR